MGKSIPFDFLTRGSCGTSSLQLSDHLQLSRSLTDPGPWPLCPEIHLRACAQGPPGCSQPVTGRDLDAKPCGFQRELGSLGRGTSGAALPGDLPQTAGWQADCFPTPLVGADVRRAGLAPPPSHSVPQRLPEGKLPHLVPSWRRLPGGATLLPTGLLPSLASLLRGWRSLRERRDAGNAAPSPASPGRPPLPPARAPGITQVSLINPQLLHLGSASSPGLCLHLDLPALPLPPARGCRAARSCPPRAARRRLPAL